MMGRSNRSTTKSHTLPSSPTHSFTSSSSSSSFEFTISLSPRKSSAALCPADELFYKGQLLPLHLSPRLSMVRTLLSSSTSTSTSTSSSETASRDSTASHSSSSDSYTDLLHHHLEVLDCDSSRPSSAADEEIMKRLSTNDSDILSRKPSKYFSLSKFSSVFRKENKSAPPSGGAATVKRVSSSAREVLRKYLKKVKPLYEKLSQKQQQQQQKMPSPQAAPPAPPSSSRTQMTAINYSNENTSRQIRQSFSGNLRYPRRSSHVSSCPSSMMSSPRHGFGFTQMGRAGFGSGSCNADSSSMEELQSAIQGAIAHCKSSMMMKKVSNEI